VEFGPTLQGHERQQKRSLGHGSPLSPAGGSLSVGRKYHSAGRHGRGQTSLVGRYNLKTVSKRLCGRQMPLD
jgi:hypothetical protein